MHEVWIYSLGSVIIVSLLALIGLLTVSFTEKKLQKILIYMVAFAAGTLFGDAFIHLLPEVVEEQGFTLIVSIYILLGIVGFLLVEKIIHWRHCHMPVSENHVHRVGVMNLVGDGAHNFLDGIIIGASYLVSIPAGIATTLAIIFHEIPQEIADFGVLLHAGFSKTKALVFNLVTALTAILGVVIAVLFGFQSEGLTQFLVPFAAGGFIYIAGADLIPELHKQCHSGGISTKQLTFFVLGIIIMLLLTFLE